MYKLRKVSSDTIPGPEKESNKKSRTSISDTNIFLSSSVTNEVKNQYSELELNVEKIVLDTKKELENNKESIIRFSEFSIKYKMVEMLLKSKKYYVSFEVDEDPVFCGYFLRVKKGSSLNNFILLKIS